ncbi:translational GTPase TypA [Loktanella salsilacus]|jgi:GTP-binding protein|uniref:Large ribosomal subunit assembly factor BipA n=1 Tax=Loktanella salsilacus TaxID=195913 RepID=A0A1I4CBK3_9RHOB|nr:translational GTPase TypA [Loktanella salsilacus]MBU0780422.1 translational GTPase TypA [Alphaproteobacteria bacterium]MBU0862453.1 translational GTPase TypA [Alphaproteobacteria bacterium]MBU1835523.1 translational GTPase TypA [Alphaproteobacteria bacterium]UTH45646.1 translational GTPase TypA [Loktanella salsilacus]UTH49420.1 translational GTPase TypA [Loktanella salsilacus]|tara:strand:+ start:355 stop:2172 length:1818 start_codon:yes stop_codon:yes gene_type:complete
MDIRNIAIIAHVDHGKTTLVDELLKQSGVYRENEATTERAMDSNDIERERGITILAKCTSVEWKGTRINIVDTPGHADFGGEVERILSMVDGVVLLVDAAEGPMPQTKFVLSKALALGLNPIVVVNKVDKADGEPDQAVDNVFDLFAALEANDQQLDFPVMFASGRAGWCDNELDGPRENLDALFDMVLKHVPMPAQISRREEPFQMLATTLSADPFIGRILTGRVEAGTLRAGETVKALSRNGTKIEQFRVSKILAFRGLSQTAIDVAEAGDIVTLAGMTKATVADTICDLSIDTAIPAQPIDPPTITVTFGINDSPLAGKDGKKVQSRVIRDRLMKEAEVNVAIKIADTEKGDAFEVSGRGELQMGVLIENMRREGFELSISRPQVIYKTIDGVRMEPIEEATIDVDDEYTGAVVEKLTGPRKGELVEMKPAGAGKTRIIAHVPSRGLIGYHGEFLTDTRGSGILNRLFHGWAPYKGKIQGRRQGVLISMENGTSVAFALWKLEDRGKFFIGAQEAVYQGMIIGEHSRDNDLEVNPLKGKQLTNVRASGTDEAVRLTTPVTMSLEQAIAYIDDDELVEVTPNAIRLRKRYLDPHERKRNAKSA